ncbi:hypothetical protein AtubIFM54640_000397 [Aspergillus tubingensis]|nr:hypothetical protein AtubIFM54640_000397 [Aspergillus tubingensis]
MPQLAQDFEHGGPYHGQLSTPAAYSKNSETSPYRWRASRANAACLVRAGSIAHAFVSGCRFPFPLLEVHGQRWPALPALLLLLPLQPTLPPPTPPRLPRPPRLPLSLSPSSFPLLLRAAAVPRTSGAAGASPLRGPAPTAAFAVWSPPAAPNVVVARPVATLK